VSGWFRTTAGGGLSLTLHVRPSAKKTEVAGLHGDALRIRLAAPPVDGRANEALLAFVAAALGVPKTAIKLKSGQSSRRKVVEVAGATPAAVTRLAQPG